MWLDCGDDALSYKRMGILHFKRDAFVGGLILSCYRIFGFFIFSSRQKSFERDVNGLVVEIMVSQFTAN